MRMAFYRLARVLQVVGLIILPVAIAGNLTPTANRLTLWQSLGLSGVGVLVFFLGWLLQQAVRPQE